MYTKLGFSALRTFERVYLLPDNSKILISGNVI